MLGLVGVGRWGQNLARNFYDLGALSVLCDRDTERLRLASKHWPDLRTTHDCAHLLEDPFVRAVAIATRADSHYSLVKAALEHDKDVYCEKPLCLQLSDAEELVAMAKERGRILMVGHLLRYHPALESVAELLAHGALGDLLYITSNRLNLGVVGMEGSALWDLAPHDVSVILSLTQQTLPTEVRCIGGAYLEAGVVDLGLLTLAFPCGMQSHVHFSWLNPYKEHRLTVIGAKAMVTFDDTAPWNRKLMLYRNPIEIDAFGKSYVAEGAPNPLALESAEPLRRECAHFLSCCATRQTPLTDGNEAVEVLRVLSAAQSSLMQGGAATSVT